MMYKQNKDFLKDFVERTICNYHKLADSPYGVTQLINSTVGLLIIPEQSIFEKICDKMISNELLSKIKSSIIKSTYSKGINLQQICRHFRNAIAHNNLIFENSNQTITHIILKDKNEKTNEQFEIKLSVELLKEFLLEFSKAASLI